MIIKRIPAGIYAANCYILVDEATKESAVIDPGGDADDLFEAVSEMGAEVKHIVLTHGHLDHTGAVRDFVNKFDVPVYVNKKDWDLMSNNEYLFGNLNFNGKYVYVNDNDVIKIGETAIECLETPGHTPGGMSYKVEDKILTGDTLFLGSIGRTDLTGGDFNVLIKSIKDKLLINDDSIVIYPGHGPSSTIGYERNRNTFLR